MGAQKVLYIGGTGEISYGCIEAGLELGQQIAVYNRGTSGVRLPEGVRRIKGDVNDAAAYAALARERWDAVCQFRCFDTDQARCDIEVFSGKTGQFVFISSATVYQRPPRDYAYRVTEDAPLGNPHSDYATKKLACERLYFEAHAAGKLPVTVVRPSHTNRVRFPGTFIGGDHIAWRLVQRKPIISHGDGTSLWAVTRCEDFGRAFARLLGNPKALGEAFHITSDESNPWDAIFRAMADELGVEANLVHVPSDTLVRYEPKWAGALHGDKTWSFVFDNSKVKAAVGGWSCRHNMRDAIAMAAPHVRRTLERFTPDAQADALMDRIVRDQQALGAASRQ